MKAEYVRPNVHFEMFNPNDAVAYCINNQNISFECLSGPNKDTATVLNSAIIEAGTSCENQAGIAWYSGVKDNPLAQYEPTDSTIALGYDSITNYSATVYTTNDTCSGLTSNSSTMSVTKTENAGTYTSTQQGPNQSGGQSETKYYNAMTAVPSDDYTFLGWLYITGYSSGGHNNSSSSWTYDLAGWTIGDNGGLLNNIYQGIHAMIAAIWASNVRAS